MKLLERNIASVDRRLVLLAPPQANVPDFFNHVTRDIDRHQLLVRAMQRLRGAVYLHDGAVERRQLSSDGLHQTPEDERSWHLLMVSDDEKVSSCVWYLEHEHTASIDELRVRNCPLNRQAGWPDKLKAAVESELARARHDDLKYAEVGGWAVAKESRCTSEGLLLALGAYSLGAIFGGALGITTATVRHASSAILRRLGGSLLEVDGTVVPPYFDPRYKCEMELLRFDSRRPNAKYGGLIERMRRRLADVVVVAAAPAVSLANLVQFEDQALPQFAA